MNYTNSVFNPKRRLTTSVKVGNRTIGGDASILVQSMTTTNTKDVDATVMQTLELAHAGCELVRITVPTVKDGEYLGEIVKKVRAAGCDVPISADIHFQPKAAMEAVKHADKVRINPGNYVDKGILFEKEWTEAELDTAHARVRKEFSPLVEECKTRGVAIRIGTNHGSLSSRMLYKFGDSAEGMVESALEYIVICEELDFHDVIFSMKASNPKVVIEAYRLLAARLDKEHRPYPFHVGVTEAGEGEDGRLKSAVGIGALLLDGISDTIRVSLTESPVSEIPVAERLIKVCSEDYAAIEETDWNIDSFHFTRRLTDELVLKDNGDTSVVAGGSSTVLVGTEVSSIITAMAGERPMEWMTAPSQPRLYSDLPWFSSQDSAHFKEINFSSLIHGLQEGSLSGVIAVLTDNVHWSTEESVLIKSYSDKILWSYVGEGNFVGAWRRLVSSVDALGRKDLMILRKNLDDDEGAKMLAAAQFGSLLCDGIGDMVHIEVKDQFSTSVNLAYDILQAAGMRRTKTEFISCPSCGRTLFDLEEVTAQIKEKTGHLKDVAIAVMGCIVNGPGEMADADFGYVGGAPDKISLYVGKEVVQKNIPQLEATDALVELIKKHGKWINPQ